MCSLQSSPRARTCPMLILYLRVACFLLGMVYIEPIEEEDQNEPNPGSLGPFLCFCTLSGAFAPYRQQEGASCMEPAQDHAPHAMGDVALALAGVCALFSPGQPWAGLSTFPSPQHLLQLAPGDSQPKAGIIWSRSLLITAPVPATLCF